MAEVILQKVAHEGNNLYDLHRNQLLIYILISTQQSIENQTSRLSCSRG